MSSKGRPSRHRNWCFTSFDEQPPTFNDRIHKYMVYQRETSPSTGTIHWQGYCQYSTSVCFETAKRGLGNESIHIEPQKGTDAQAIGYCYKDETAIPNTRVEFGIPNKQGYRTDLDDMVDMIVNGSTKREILLTHKGNALRHMHCIDRAQKALFLMDKTDNEILNMDPRIKRIMIEHNKDFEKNNK